MAMQHQFNHSFMHDSTNLYWYRSCAHQNTSWILHIPSCFGVYLSPCPGFTKQVYFPWIIHVIFVLGKKVELSLCIGQNKSHQSICRQLLCVSCTRHCSRCWGHSNMRQSLGARSSQTHEETDSQLPNSAWMGKDIKRWGQEQKVVVLNLEGQEDDRQWALFKSQPQCFQILNEVLFCSGSTFFFQGADHTGCFQAVCFLPMNYSVELAE